MKNYFLWMMVLLFVSACAPRTTQVTGLESSAARQAQTTAEEAYHRMEIGKLQTGEYSPNALIDLELPKGILWTIESFGADSYRLRVASQDIRDYSWLVTPEGVQLLTAVSPPG